MPKKSNQNNQKQKKSQTESKVVTLPPEDFYSSFYVKHSTCSAIPELVKSKSYKEDSETSTKNKKKYNPLLNSDEDTKSEYNKTHILLSSETIPDKFLQLLSSKADEFLLCRTNQVNQLKNNNSNYMSKKVYSISDVSDFDLNQDENSDSSKDSCIYLHNKTSPFKLTKIS